MKGSSHLFSREPLRRWTKKDEHEFTLRRFFMAALRPQLAGGTEGNIKPDRTGEIKFLLSSNFHKSQRGELQRKKNNKKRSLQTRAHYD